MSFLVTPGLPTPGPSSEKSLARQLRDAHLGSLVAGAALLFVALKVLAVSHYQTTTAVGIVAESGTTSLVLGSLIQTLPVVLLAILSALVFLANDETKPPADAKFFRVLAWTMAFVAAWAQPVWLAPFVLIITWLLLLGPGSSRVILRILRRVWARSDRKRLLTKHQVERTKRSIAESRESSKATREDFDRTEEALRAAIADPSTSTTEEREVLLDSLRRVPDTLLAETEARVELADRAVKLVDEIQAGVGRRIRFLETAKPIWLSLQRNLALSYAVVVLVIGGFGTTPWVPLERVVVDAQPAVTGYVLSSGQDTTVVLLDGTRRIVRLQGTTVTRLYCEAGSNTSRFIRPMAALFHSSPSYPACRDLRP